MSRYVCSACAARHEISPDRFRCDCGAPLDLDFEPGFPDRASLARRPDNLWRWREALPFADGIEPVTLGEGCPPVVDATFGGVGVRLVLEYVSPTGSYKDRGAALLVAAAAFLGANPLVDDTSGNAGIALAAYAARAGLTARLFVPEEAAPAKPRLARALGAELVRVGGGRSGAAAAAVEEAESGLFYASHAWSPFFLHGAKTLAFALVESSLGTPPGAVIVPAGNGGLVLGLDLGFRELLRHGLIERRPAILAVQAARCAPLARAFESGETIPRPAHEEPTVADGVRVGAPPRGAAVLEAVRRSGGRIDAAEETEIVAARGKLWGAGFVVESTSALAVAPVLREGPALRDRYGDLAVVLTGSGLKG